MHPSVRWLRNGEVVLAASAVLLVLVTPVAGRAQFDPLCGDVNASGEVTLSDCIAVLGAAAELNTGCSLAACDIDRNGIVTLADGVNALRLLADLPVDRPCRAGEEDPFIARAGVGEEFGALTKVPIVSLPGAPDTISVRFLETAQPGRTVGFVVAPLAPEVQAAGAPATHLFVASRRAESAASTGSFRIPFESSQGEATILVDIRDDAPLEQVRIDLATGVDSLVTGRRESILVLIVNDQPPLCGNRNLDAEEACDPPGSRCDVGGFCNEGCECELTGPTCGNGLREGSEECDAQQAGQCGGAPCRSDCTCEPGQLFVFDCTFGPQMWTAPDGVTSVFVAARGANGGGFNPPLGGAGACASATFAVTPNQVFHVFVGCAGSTEAILNAFNGGGRQADFDGGGGGGGASDIRIGGTSLADRRLIAGGGGGVGGDPPGGGAGGFPAGTSGGGENGGGGGTQDSGGLGGTGLSCPGSAGTLGNGGDGGAGCVGAAGSQAAGGGGGGLYGGGGGSSGGNGGGGSSLVPPGGSTSGCGPGQSGNGRIVITYGSVG